MPFKNRHRLPRVLVAGLAGDSGKTLVALGLVKAFVNQNLKVAAFKKGPDFIDAAWLGQAAGSPGRNLDTFMMPAEAVLGSLLRAGENSEMAIIEGNRGLFDGLDVAGSQSTAELAKLTKTPVILVVDTTKVTRTVAALVLGCLTLDPEVAIVGVILNRVGAPRQETLIRRALSKEVGVEVLGSIPRLQDQFLPSRHLGLVTSVEHSQAEEMLERVAEVVAANADLAGILKLSQQASAIPETEAQAPKLADDRKVRIGVLQDRAFSFYYPENLEALQSAGAELVSISPLVNESLPQIDALYAGGGFPEVYARELSRNQALRRELAQRIEEGLPVWAECGGLMYLSQAMCTEEQEYPMVGALPVTVEQTQKPQGHGYVQARVDSENPFLREGMILCGHEFHYSRLKGRTDQLRTVLALQRGVGVGFGRDGIQADEIVASYTHLHALGVPEWGPALVQAAAGGGRGESEERSETGC
jgi:cobyrinic acid a,c-diamide synthase